MLLLLIPTMAINVASMLQGGLYALVGLTAGMAVRRRIATGTYHRWLHRVLFLIAILLIVQYAGSLFIITINRRK